MLRLLPLLALVLFVGACDGLASPQEKPLAFASSIKTWAIVGDPAAIESGVTDAVFAELSAATDMQFVEREQLDQAVNEQTLQTIMGSLAAESKRLGQILKADALILVSHVDKPKDPDADPRAATKSLRLVLCECSQGLRLGELKIDLKPVDQQAKLLAQYIQDRRQQFAGGIRSIVGLAPIVCRNIDDEYDHWHQRYFDILAGRLMTVPGLAILELEEARSIAREVGVAEQAMNRLMPVMVECEYEVRTEEQKPSVQFNVQLTSRKRESLQSPKLGLQDAVSWVGNELVADVLEKTEGQPLPLADQQKLLTDRANYLLNLGDLAGSVRCREAFLLAEAGNAAERTLLIENLLTLNSVLLPKRITPFPRLKDYVSHVVEKAAIQTPILLDHLTYLIENRLIDRATAMHLFYRMNNDARFLNGRGALISYYVKDPVDRANLTKFFSAQSRFILSTAAKALDLPEPNKLTPEENFRQRAEWHACIQGMMADQIAINCASVDSLRLLERVIRETVPEDMPTSWEIFSTLGKYQRSFQAFRIMSPDGTMEQVDIVVDEVAFQKWLERICNSDHLHLRWYGRIITLQNKRKAAESPLPELKKEADTLLSQVQSRPFSRVRWSNGVLVEPAFAMLGEQTPPINSGNTNTANTKPAPVAPPKPALPASEVVAGDLVLRQISVDLPKDEKGIVDIFKARDGVDVVVGEKKVGLLTDPNSFLPIHTVTSRDPSAVWDGQHVWIAERDKGITQYDLTGKLVRRIGEPDGLPKHDQSIKLLALEPGKLLVQGTVARELGCWLLLLDVTADKPQLKNLHEGRQPYRALPNPKNARMPLINHDASLIYRLDWWCLCIDRGLRLVIIGRQASPLVIDIDTAKVLAEPLEPQRANPMGMMLTKGGLLFKAFPTGVAQYEIPAGSMRPQFKRMVVDGKAGGGVPLWVDENGRLVEHDGWIYKSGKVWYRFRPDGSSLQRLNQPDTVRSYDYERVATSHHYGLIGWAPQNSSRSFYKIVPP